MLTTFFTLLLAGLSFFVYQKWKKLKAFKIIKKGDIVVLKEDYKKEYPLIPPNNLLHIIDVESSSVNIEYINFKDGTFQTQKISKDVLRKVRDHAA